MAEEHRCQAPPEGHRPCANNCGFFGSPATMNLCSNCYRDFCLKEQQQKQQQQTSPLASSLPLSPLLPLQPSPSASSTAAVESRPELAVPEAWSTGTEEAAVSAVEKTANRCTACRKKVGLTGFRCRCGTTFCGVHRYPEKHGCTFDFKKAGREEIARANPLVVADKLQRI